MNKIYRIILTFLFSAFPNTVLLAALPAANDTELDSNDINIAMTALQAGKFDQVVAKTDLVITRFEKNKSDDSYYVCTDGQVDTLSALLGAAVENDKGKSGSKTSTIAVPSAICTAYFLKGFVLIDLKRRNEALPNLQMAVQMDPDNQHYINELGEWHKTEKDWPKALEIFTQASETTDLSVETMKDQKAAKKIINDMRCRSYRGIAYTQIEMKQWDNARNALEKCFKLIPNEPGSINELAYIKEQSGQ